MTPKENLNEVLLEAAKQGNLNEVQHLVEHGADVNVVDDDGVTPFLWAYFKGHKDIVKYLLSKGGNINYDGFDEGTLLMAAAGDVEFVSFLLDAGAEVNHPMPRGGETALHHAASKKGQTAVVKLLIERGGNVNHRAKSNAYSALNYFGTFWGETPLHVAAVCGDREMIEVLLAASADKTIHTAEGKTPFILAKEHQRSAEILELLR